MKNSFDKPENHPIWMDIKDIDTYLFSLPTQYLHKFAEPSILSDDETLYISTKSTVLSTALYDALYKKYDVSLYAAYGDKMIISISKTSK